MRDSFFYPDHRTVVPQDWPHQNFTPSEIACKQIHKDPRTGTVLNCGCGGSLLHDLGAMSRYQKFREILGIAHSPNSAYRCPVHNRNVGGAPKSYHAQGRAFDVPLINGITRQAVHAAAKQAGFLGIADYKTFVHIDDRELKWYADFR